MLDKPSVKTSAAIEGDVARVINNYGVEAACTCMSTEETFAEGRHPVLTGRALISTTQNGTAAAWIPSPRSSVQSDGRLHVPHPLASAFSEPENLSPGLKIAI